MDASSTCTAGRWATISAGGMRRASAAPASSSSPSVTASASVNEPMAVRRRAPRVGQHTVEVFRELGLPDDDLDRLLAAGALVGEPTPA